MATAVGSTAIVLLYLLWSASDVLLLLFAAILVAIFLRGSSNLLGSLTGLSPAWSLASVLLALVLILSISIWFLAPRVAAQSDQISKGLAQSVQQLEAVLRQYDPGHRFIPETSNLAELSKRTNLLSQVTGMFTTTLSGIANAVIIGFIGLYLAANPGVYIQGTLHLFLKARRDRIGNVLTEVGETLQFWLIGRFLLMAVNGVLTAFGLWLLGIPMALTLGLLAGILNFIPNIGPIIAAVPAVLIGWTQGPMTALYVLLLYLVLQNLDGYVFTPIVQKRTVSLPPALTLFSQLLFGVLAGGVGLLLATPIIAAMLLIVKRLYVEDFLGEKESNGSHG